MARRILGLDIGSHSVKAVEFRQTLRDLEVVQLQRLPLVDPGPTLAVELRDFLQMHDFPSDHVVVALSGDRISTRRLSFPFRDRKKIAPAVPFEVESQVPYDLDEFFVDWEIVGESRGRTDVVATLAPRAEVALLLDTLLEANVDPRIVEAEGLALANLASLFELEGTRLIADMGHRKTTLCLCVDGRAVAARTVPIAGRAITEALAKERNLGEVEAERIKEEVGIFGGGGQPDSPGAIAVVDRLAREMVRTLGSLEPVLAGDEAGALEEIILAGGSAHLHRLEAYLSERIGLPVVRMPLPPGDTGSALLAGGDPQIFAPALSLAVRGSMRARTRMNFRQDEYAHRVDFKKVGKELRWTGVLAGLAVVLGLGAVGTGIALQNRRAETIESQSLALYQEAFPSRPVPTNVVGAMRDAVSSAQDRADTLGVYRGNLSALDVLTQVSAHVPADLEVVFQELSIDRQVVQIRGQTQSFESVDRMRAELARYTPFSEISVGEVQRNPRTGQQEFELRINMQAGGQP